MDTTIRPTTAAVVVDIVVVFVITSDPNVDYTSIEYEWVHVSVPDKHKCYAMIISI